MTLATEVDGGIAHLRLDRPQLHNVLDRRTLDELTEALHGLDARVIVLSGSGPGFCAGVDLGELRRAEDSGVRGILLAGRRAYQALLGTDAVTVAVVHGRATGAGVALAAGCDLRIAHPDATFSLPELSHGMGLSWGGAMPRLLDEVGPAALRRIALLGERVTADEAARIGLVHEVSDDPGELAEQWAARCLSHHAGAVGPAKRQLRSHTRTGSGPAEFDEDLLAAGFLETRRSGTGLFARPPGARPATPS
ncbi:enoyl-CoA hydratase/isomerase family protein [Streptomyces sp. HNM0574]|uniref:enoyl-CoA hydratase/isomerase family protein n=1 Tax=Streptomyces sp. HNM0574 TaxID=2714954 RepID=UPI00146B05D2|nr:enoyl-CoA hydratase/isomerase family protein [Streptomyces sp. HNM0574]NLU70708.1 enoyl-CoA hydratase/isomerase family protein [Streptomyces sp. HNM0574]